MTFRILLLLCVFAAGGEAAAQSVGRVLAAAGEVVAVRNGRDVPLATGADLQNGDLVRTGAASAAQLRFTDETIVALREKSRFLVADYRFTGQDDGVSQAAYRLLQGGFRTITGLIGRTRPTAYRVTTPLASIGIRGTAYTLVLCQDDCVEDGGAKAPDGAYGVVYDGRVAVENAAGSAEFGADEAFFVADARTAPQPLVARPGFLRDRQEARARREQLREAMDQRAQAAAQAAGREFGARLAEARNPAAGPNAAPDVRPIGQAGTAFSPIIAVTDINDPDGNVALLGAGLGAGASFALPLDGFAAVDGGRGTVIVLDGDRGLVEAFSFNDGALTGNRQGAAVVNNGLIPGDGGATWGRWTTGATVSGGGQTGSPPTGVHFFFGNLTPEALFGTPLAGATAVRYGYVGGTQPTDAQGNTGTFLSGHFDVNFVQRTLGGELIYRVDTYTYRLPVPEGTPIVTGRGFAGFSVDGRNAGTWSCSCNNTTGSVDRYQVSGLFLGSRAQGLGTSFATADAQVGRTAGTAIFRCTGSGCR